MLSRLLFTLLVFIPFTAEAGHLFTQAQSNTPTWIQSGQGIVIEQYGTESGNSSGNFSFNFAANSTTPDGADNSNNNWWTWSSGDVMRITLPMDDATYTYTVAYDSATGDGCAYDYCGATNDANFSDAAFASAIIPEHTGQATSYTDSDVAFSWSVEALAGEFSLAGYRIYATSGIIDGTGAGPLTQDSVVSSDEVAQNTGGGSSAPDIDQGKSNYTIAELNSNSVNPKFSGGTLTISDNAGPVIVDFTVDANGGSISNDALVEITGNITDDTVTSGGALNKIGSGKLQLSGNNTFSGGMNVQSGELQLDGSLTSAVYVASGATLSGNGTVAGITSEGTISPGNSPGTLTSTADVVLDSGSITLQEIDGIDYSIAGGAGSYDRLVLTGAGTTYSAAGDLQILIRGITEPANNNFTPAVGDLFTIVTTENDSGISGSYDLITQPATGLSYNTRFDVLYGEDTIDLVLTPEDYLLYARSYGNGNMQRFVRASNSYRLDPGLRATTGLPEFYNSLIGLDDSGMLTALGQASGEIHALSMNNLKDILSDIGRFNRDQVLLDDESQLWFKLQAHYTDYSSDNASHGYSSDNYAITLGKDLHFNDELTYGVGLAIYQFDIDAGSFGQTDSKAGYLLGYYSEKFNSYDLDVTIGFGRSSRKIRRSVTLANMVNQHKAETYDWAGFGSVSFAKSILNNETSHMSLFTRINTQWIEGNNYSESGSSLTAVTIKKDDGGQLSSQLEIGLSGSDYAVQKNTKLNAGLSLFSDLITNERTSDRQLRLHDVDWTVKSPDVGEIGLRMDLGFEWAFDNQANMSFSGMTELSEGRNNHAVKFGITRQF